MPVRSLASESIESVMPDRRAAEGPADNQVRLATMSLDELA